MKVKHFINVNDFVKADYLEIFRRARIFQKGGDFTHLCRGKVLATMFFQESTRTMSISQAAITKLGGGWTGVSGQLGSYLGANEEDLEDTLASMTSIADIMIVRHKSADLGKLVKNFSIPVINGMCGKEEHSLGAAALGYALYRLFGDLAKIKVGFYGMIGSSRPAKAMIKLLAMFGVTIYIDSVTEDFQIPHKSKFIEAKLADFIKKIDFLMIIEGLPQPGEDRQKINRFLKAFQPISKKEISQLRPKAFFSGIMPRILPDGRLTYDKALDSHPQNISSIFLKDWLYLTMTLITYLLNIKIIDKSFINKL